MAHPPPTGSYRTETFCIYVTSAEHIHTCDTLDIIPRNKYVHMYVYVCWDVCIHMGRYIHTV
jgi:hypothetical protein